MIHIMLNAVKMLNFFPIKGGISNTLSPKTIMSGETLDYKKHLSLQVGQYCQVHNIRRKVPCAIVKIRELRVPFCLDPVVISKEDTSSWL
jgi:hypothetical protein